MNVLVTGSEGFIGRNLRVALERRPGIFVACFDVNHPIDALDKLASQSDIVFHLAGVNRPEDPDDFWRVNVGLTRAVANSLARSGRQVPVVFSSSIQAELDNPYGRSKRAAEDILRELSERVGNPVRVFRFPNVFGKWSRPNYNSVVSTFCHNISRGRPVEIHDRDRLVTFVYIDEVVRVLCRCLDESWTGFQYADVEEKFQTSVGRLYENVMELRRFQTEAVVPDLSSPFMRYLLACYIAAMDPDARSVVLQAKRDHRGWLVELLRSRWAGQVFVSVTRPGVVRGNHYHDTKVEQFCVIRGRGRVRMRPVLVNEPVLSYEVSEDPIRVVHIPPGWTHSLENIGETDLITVFWASEPFDPSRPDTFEAPVDPLAFRE